MGTAAFIKNAPAMSVAMGELQDPLFAPDIMEFVVSDRYLNRGGVLYPRQATLLKVIFLRDDLLTQYDYDVLGEWSEGFRLPEPGEAKNPDVDSNAWYRYEAQGGMAVGIQPDWYERMKICQREGRPWFREIVPILGRRGSKGHIGGICGSTVLWHYICKEDPQGYYGIDRDKTLLGIVFAGKMQQAKENQWKDLVSIIRGAPCFHPFISFSLGESLSVFAPSDAKRILELAEAGIDTTMDMATFRIVPKESTLMAGRGPTSFMQFYDEMGHVVATGANRSAEEVYQAATPALDQFGTDGFIYEGSSPWQMTGQLYENYLQALAVDPITKEPLRPEMLMLQLPSWGLYEDWQIADKIPMAPGDKGQTFSRKIALAQPPEIGPYWSETRNGLITVVGWEKVKDSPLYEVELLRRSSYAQGKDAPEGEPEFYNPIQGAIQEYDEQMRRLEKANPDTFRVERLSQWAAAMDAYLNAAQIEEMFGPWQGETLTMQSQGILSRTYVAHGDPSKSGANFGFAVAHREGPDENGMYHVVFDKIHAWHPSDYEDSRIDYIQIEEEILEIARAFMPSDLTFDQFNSAGMIQRIQIGLDRMKLPRRTSVYEVTATAPFNWKLAETFKTALNMGLVHAPYYELAELELRFLQLTANQKVDHQTSGPVQTKDVADAMFNVVYSLIGEQMGVFLRERLGKLSVSGSQAGGVPLSKGSPGGPRDDQVFSALSSLGQRSTQRVQPRRRAPR